MSKIKFDYAVIYDGVLYPSNTEIEVKEPKAKKPVKKAVAIEDDNGKDTKS